MAERMPRSSCAYTGVLSPASIEKPTHGLTRRNVLLHWYNVNAVQANATRSRWPASAVPATGVDLLDRNALREVAWLIDVAAAADGDVVREQLQRHDHQYRRQQRMRLGYGDQEVLRRIQQRADPVVAFRGDRDHRPAARLRLLDVADHLLEHVVVRGNRDDRHLLVDQRDRSVLHLARRVALGVDVRDLLQLQRSLEGDGIVDPPPEIQDVAAL